MYVNKVNHVPSDKIMNHMKNSEIYKRISGIRVDSINHVSNVGSYVTYTFWFKWLD